jgi:hypothetical protein
MHLRCDITHGKGEETIARSVAFLLSYENDLQFANTKNSNFAGNYSCNILLMLNRFVFKAVMTRMRKCTRATG